MDGIQKSKHHYILILCGGTGPRLWPLSRASHPKQFLKLFNGESLLLSTIKRAGKIVPKSNIFLISNERYLNEIKAHTQSIIPSKNIIAEPQKKNTFMAILYSTAIIRGLDPDAIITTLPSDHFIKKLHFFKRDIQKSAEIAQKTNSLVSIGIKPTSPNPAFGYILPDTKKTNDCYKVTKFIEKPKREVASNLIKLHALWNAGMYTFASDYLLEETAKLQKDYFKLYSKIENEINNPKIIKKVYDLSPNLPIDIAISEKSNRFVMIKANFQWNDVGEWNSIFQELPKNKDGVSKLNNEVPVVNFNSSNCLVSSRKNKMIGLVGVNNLAVIDTPDALLICDLSQSFNVRDLVGQIVKTKSTQNYFLTQNEDK